MFVAIVWLAKRAFPPVNIPVAEKEWGGSKKLQREEVRREGLTGGLFSVTYHDLGRQMLGDISYTKLL